MSLGKYPGLLFRESLGNILFYTLNFKMISNLVLVISSKVEIGSCFVDQM